MEPKDPENIYKTHLENPRFSSVSNVDSAKQNLAASFVNGLVNCAFGKDNTMTKDGNKWIYRHKTTGVGRVGGVAGGRGHSPSLCCCRYDECYGIPGAHSVVGRGRRPH